MKRFIFVITLCIIIASCFFGPDGEDFSFKIRVVDTDGNPVEGLNVSLINKIDSPFWEQPQWSSRAQTYIPFTLLTNSFVEMYVEDIKRNHVRNLLSEECIPAIYSRSWNGMDDNDNPLASGVYYSTLKFSENDTLYYHGEGVMYLLSFNESNKNGTTDTDGIFTCTSKKPFINLFNVDSLYFVDDIGEILGREAFSDTTAIYLFFEDGLNEANQFEFIVANNGENELEIIWDPEEIMRTNGDEISKYITRDSGDILQPIEIGELYNYPNPFN